MRHRREDPLSNLKCDFPHPHPKSLINVENFKKGIMLPEVLRDFAANCLKSIGFSFLDKPIKKRTSGGEGGDFLPYIENTKLHAFVDLLLHNNLAFCEFLRISTSKVDLY